MSKPLLWVATVLLVALSAYGAIQFYHDKHADLLGLSLVVAGLAALVLGLLEMERPW